MSNEAPAEPALPFDHAYAEEIVLERAGWYELARLVRELTPEETLQPGYYRGPDWAVRDVVAHLGAWLAEAQAQFERMHGGTYAGHDIDVDALNAQFLVAMADQSWATAWLLANAGRSRMLETWYALSRRDDEAAWWVRKAGPEHYSEHLGRLRAWVLELQGRRQAG
jgi:hypothetical protein